MTREELIAYQAKEKAFYSTPIGAAFSKFKRTYGAAWQTDTESGFRNDSGRRAKRLWEIADKAEAELRELLEKVV